MGFISTDSIMAIVEEIRYQRYLRHFSDEPNKFILSWGLVTDFARALSSIFMMAFDPLC
jgi:hypothetical protein